jgi:ATP-binding cassette, subfamily B, multidrug efflux pump
MLIRTLRTFLAPYSGLLWLVLILSLVGTMASLYLPNLNAAIIDQGVAKGDTGFIWRTGGLMLAFSALQGLCAATSVYFGARTAMSFGRDLRGAIFARVLAFSAREMNSLGAPSLITRTTNDVQQVQMLVLMSCTMLVSAPITMVGGVFMAVREDVGLSWLLLLAVPVLIISIGLLVMRMGPLFRVMQTRIDTLNRVLREQITGIRVVRAFVREPVEQQRFARANADLAATATSVGVLMATLFPLIMLIMNVFSVAVLWFGAHRIAAGHMQVGSLTAFLSYLIQILMSVMMATFLFVLAPRAAVCADRIQEVLRTEPSVVPPARGVLATTGPNGVEMRAAQFTYPGAESPVVSNLSFIAAAGQTTAIIGSTGAGKTTLISLIPRLIDVTGGSVLVGGVDIRALDPDVLGNKIGLVPQKSYLFSGTVASNLRYGKTDASDAELWHALEVAQAADFVRAMPGALEAAVSQGGSSLSGGQRQRLAIARALVRRPDIYLFDDSFSAIDVATDARLRAALKPVTRQAVVIIVSQRVATIADADRILVLEHGLIVGDGTHAALLASCPTYVEIVDSQLSAEEAA